MPELAGNDLLLEAIVKLTRDDLLETRRNAVIALFNVVSSYPVLKRKKKKSTN